MKQPFFSDVILTYKSLIIVVANILMTSIAISITQGRWMINFMGLFFVIFSLFKLIDIKGFAKSFEKYDIIAKKYKIYAFIYPYIEFALGLLYLSYTCINLVNYVTFTLMIISLYSIFKNLKNSSNSKCACLGSIINLPLGKISIIENLGMSMMSLYMILL